jgi:hypothetical protein
MAYVSVFLGGYQMTTTSQSDSSDQTESIVRITIDEALAPLKDINPATHNLLMNCCSVGFFEQSQSKSKFKLLASQLLKTILVEGDKNAD